jgi:UDP-GlcNAc:undecaprenyl-phosphate GlcNAc-1-phosphate transferase
MQVTNLFPSMAIAFIVTVALMFALRPVAIGVGLVDHPGGRKIHEGIVPVMGGIAMFFGIFAGVSLLGLASATLISVVLGSILLLVVGVADDRFDITAAARITAQVAVVLLMFYGAGLRLSDIGDPFGTGVIEMGRFTLIFTLLVTVTMVNAYNLIDGADGLAGSLAAIAMLGVAAVAGIGNIYSAVALTVAAAAAGFLIFNFPTSWNRKVRAFMGDAGSTLLGFTIVWVTLGVCQGAERVISPVHCLWFAALPIFDLLTCFAQRIRKGKSPFSPGRDHVHHILKRGGFHTRRKLAILTGIQTIYTVVGITGHFMGVPDVVMFAAWAVVGVSQGFVIRRIARWRRLKGRSTGKPRPMSLA